MQTKSMNAKLGLLGKKMTLGQAVKAASCRVVLEGDRNETHQVLRELFAYYIENAEEEQILPVLIDLELYGWAGKESVIDLVLAELNLTEQSASFVEGQIRSGKLLLLCRNAPANNALKSALDVELTNLGPNCKVIIRQQALLNGTPFNLTRVKIPPPITKQAIKWGIPSLSILCILLGFLALTAWRSVVPPKEEIAIRDFWEPFIKDGAVMVLAEAPLVFTGPDARHEVPPGPLRLEVLLPTHPRDFGLYREKGDFKTLGEILEGADSQREKYEIQRIYKGLQLDKIVPHYVIPTPGYTGVGDARAIAEVMGTLLRIDPTLVLPGEGNLPRLRVETDSSVMQKINNQTYHKQNLIIFGGAGSNDVTKYFDKLLDRMAPNQRYHHGPREIHGDIDGMGRKIADYSAEEEKDCGSFVYLPPNFLGENNPHGHVAIFDGYENPGTLAAAYITTRPIMHILRKINYLKGQAIQLEIQVEKVINGRDPVLNSIRLVEGSLMTFTLGGSQQ